jgi:hypothetical protein
MSSLADAAASPSTFKLLFSSSVTIPDMLD